MRRVQRLLLIAIATMAVLFPATAGAATLHATPSNFSSVYAGAQGGDTILLASGAYGSFNGSAKSGMVTIDEESGASATFSSSDFSSVRNLTLKNVSYTGSGICITVPANTNMHLILDGLNMGSVGQSCREGRISIIGTGTPSIDGNGVQIKNSKFGPGGCSDGIQDSTQGTEIGPNNEFTGITQSCPASQAHADSVQPYASNYVHIHDNWFHGVEQGIMSPDGVSTGYLIENNAFEMDSHNYPCMHLGDTRNGTVRHNVCDTYIRIYGGNQNVNSQNMTIRDNASDVQNSGCTNCTIDHNSTNITFTGGTGRCAWATASPKGTASDGTDIGLNDCGGTQPPPDADGDGVPDSSDLCPGTPPGTQVDSSGCPFTPPTDHTPVAAFTDSPDPSAPGQAVTFDATTTTCDDTPCTYVWEDDGPDGAGGTQWPLGTGQTLSFTFQDPGTKSVRLTVTDVDGDTDTVMHPHEVSTTQPPPDTTPPDTTITSAPSDGTSTSASISFTGTDNVGVDHFDCQLDGGAYASCTSPKTYSGLAVGTHTFNVKAVDAAGNADPSAATATWTISSPPTSSPPTFKAEYESAWNSTANKSVSVPVVAGDVLVAYAGSQDSPNALSIGGTGLTWTLKQSSNTSASAYVWTATATSTTTATVNVTDSSSSWHYGVDVLKFGNSTGIGASNKSATQSVTLTTTKDASAIVKFVTDWNAVSGASRNSLTTGVGAFTETTYFLDAGQYTVYGGYHANVGTAGSKTVGYNAPTGMQANTLAVEVKGT